jgi:hypothetical protein
VKIFSGKKNAQRGAALILFATVLILGVAWYTVGALGKAPVATAERDIKTGLALQAAKQALLGYVAQYAARTDHDYPGRLPCPESLNAIGTANEGQANSNCGNGAAIGRLPWQTLAIDKPLDGAGEVLWYAISPGFRGVAPITPINFGTTGQLTYNDVATSAVAVIIAPGRPLNTISDPAALPGWCPAKVNQNSATRNTAPLAAANFLECGNATGSYRNPGTSQWTNDRALAITASEWADAIAPGVNDRIQRQVAPVLGDWHQLEFATTGKSWAATHGISYLPFASTWLTGGGNNPTNNNYCGNDGVEGLPPTAQGCYDNPWTGSVSGGLSGLVNLGCTDQGTYLRCQFLRVLGLLGPATITATAVDVGRTYRSTIDASNITVTGGGTATVAMAISGANSNATATITVTWPPLGLGLVTEVRIPHLQEAAALSDARLTWWRSNNWHYYTYYAIAPAAAAPATAACVPGATCLTAGGLPATTGPTDAKRMVLTLMGRPLAGQSHPSNALADYLESGNLSTGDNSFVSANMSSTFNDRLAVCPFKYVNHAGADVVICN